MADGTLPQFYMRPLRCGFVLLRAFTNSVKLPSLAHLDQRTRVTARQRFFKSIDGFNLALAQPFGDQRWHMPQPSLQGLGLGQPAPQRLRTVDRPFIFKTFTGFFKNPCVEVGGAMAS